MGLTQWETLCGLFFCFFEKIVVPILTSGGYVGLSLAVLLAQHHQVTAVDIVPEKVELINSKKSPIQDEYIEKYLAEKELNRLQKSSLQGKHSLLKLHPLLPTLIL